MKLCAYIQSFSIRGPVLFCRVCLLKHYFERVYTDGLNNLKYSKPRVTLFPLYTNISTNIRYLEWNKSWTECPEKKPEVQADKKPADSNKDKRVEADKKPADSNKDKHVEADKKVVGNDEGRSKRKRRDADEGKGRKIDDKWERWV